jgi:hypothetical protein
MAHAGAFHLAAVFFALCFYGGVAFAQEPSRDEQEGRFARIRSWLNEQQDRYQTFSDRLDQIGIAPDIGTLGQGSGLSAGITFRTSRPLRLPLDVESSVGFSYRGYERYGLRVGSLRNRQARTTLHPPDSDIAGHFETDAPRKPGLGVYADIRYRHSPLRRFFGTGPDSRTTNRTSFLLRGASYDVVSEYQAAPWLGFAMRTGIIDLEIGPGRDRRRASTERVFDASQAPGLLRQPAYFHFGTALTADGRDSASAPTSGGFLAMALWRFDAIQGASDFSRAAFDARYYVPATSSSVVAFRLIASSDFADAGSRVPFYLQPTLGGGELLRGFGRERFRDGSLVNVSTEYRWDVHSNVELAAFGDAGRVAPTPGAMDVGRFEATLGAGVRLKMNGAVAVRADWAFSREGHRLIFATGPVF